MPLLSVVTERRDEVKENTAPTPKKPPALAPPEGLADHLRPFVAEAVGTFALTLVGAGGEVIAHVSGGEVSHAARAVAPGLMVLALIYAIGDASGAHFNPAVTFAFAAAPRLPLDPRSRLLGRAVPGCPQCRRAAPRPVRGRGRTRREPPHHGVEASFVMEIVLTACSFWSFSGRRPATVWSAPTPPWPSARPSPSAAYSLARSVARP